MVTLTVFFEDPFWVGVVERAENDCLSTAKIVFGSEPTDRLVFQFILDSYQTLRFSEPVQGGLTAIKAKNPKRLQREIRDALLQKGVSTRSQMAMQQERERLKSLHEAEKKRNREENERERYRLRQQKKKERHRGK
ncbi:MAG TPA: YjdF family protein [Thermotogota bacterium]|nr:YjdF family protein [Thermotogota bacterium]HNR64332.1 YjdF family protein [Thermotogota bacterium]HNT96283.1 YjdF family protein [Thermotogota bacterium]HOZ12933.1 YjdF family protein [Thermotogota bacterium]HPB88356.1 YjdF family protein [Thermotogota bacterium]